MGETLFHQLRGKDPGIAAEFQNAMAGKKPDAKLDIRGAERVFKKVIDDRTITSKEAEALVLIIDAGVLSPEAEKHLLNKLGESDSEEAIIRGTARRLTSDADLRDFNKALDLRFVQSITFWSPGTHIHYRPIHYLAIKQLVASGKIQVFELAAAGLNRLAHLGLGNYDHNSNRFNFYSRHLDVDVVVHEATHAIQDWRDRSAATKFLEADAYIAEAVVRVDQDLDIGMLADQVKAAMESGAVDLVLDPGKAVQGNKPWEAAYQKVVESVVAGAQNPKDMDADVNMNERGGPEWYEWHKVMGALNNKHAGPGKRHAYEL